MRNRILWTIGCLLCLLLCAAGCSRTVDATPVQTAATAAPSVSPQPTAAPTPIAVNGNSVENGVLRTVAEAEDFAQIEQIPNLQVLDVSGSTCYDAILSYASAHPLVKVVYTVAIGAVTLASDASSAVVPCVPDASLLAYLPALKAVTVTEPMTADEANALLEALPDAALSYAVSFAGRTVDCSEEALDLSDVSPALCEEIAAAVAALPALNEIRLNRTDGSSAWTLEEAGALMAVRPTLRVDLNVTAFGVHFSLIDDVVSFNNVYLAQRKDELLSLLPYLRNVGRLDMEECGIPDAEMAALRGAYPSPKIVWRIHVGPYSCRTDAIMIHFSNFIRYPMLQDKDVGALIYCNEVKYLDLGHNLIQDAYFVAYMPNLEVCILAIHQPTDISAFANCPHLEYAELFNGNITDVSPLANCKELKHLNLSMNQITDITPLFGLTKLERLWISKNPIPEEQFKEFQERIPNCVLNTTSKDPTLNEWRWDYSRPSRYSERYELLRKQFQYETGITSYTEEPDFD